MHPTALIRGAVVAGSLATAGLAGLSAFPAFRPSINPLHTGRLAYEEGRPIRNWTLKRSDGSGFTERDLVGRWNVVFVGYTRCPDVCPATLSVLASVMDQLPDIQPVFLSVDPERDQALSAYVSTFHPSLVGLTGSPEALRHASDSLGASFSPSSTQPGLIDHSTSLFVVDPMANAVGVLLRPTRGQGVVEDLRALQQEAIAPLHGELWSPATPSGAPGVTYGTLRTSLDEPVWVVGVSSPDIETVELHETVQQAGIARMVRRRRLLVERDVPAVMEPGGLHLMLTGVDGSREPLIDWQLQDGQRALLRVVSRSR